MRQQDCSGWGQPNLSGVSLEQLQSELRFQRLDSLREGRLGDVEARGGASEMPGRRDLYECPELPQFHEWPIMHSCSGRQRGICHILALVAVCRKLPGTASLRTDRQEGRGLIKLKALTI